MGLSTAGVFIKLPNPKDYDSDEIIKYFFSPFQSKSSTWNGGFDIRDNDKVRIAIHQNGINISSSQFVSEVLTIRNIELIKRIYNYFGQPKIIFAYMNYGSGGSHGFRIIQDCYTIRSCYTTCGNIRSEEGTPFPIEVEFMNKKFFLEGEDEDTFLMYNLNTDSEHAQEYYYIPESTTPIIMKKYLGFNYYEENLEISNSYYFLTKEIQIPKSNIFTRIFKRKEKNNNT